MLQVVDTIRFMNLDLLKKYLFPGDMLEGQKYPRSLFHLYLDLSLYSIS